MKKLLSVVKIVVFIVPIFLVILLGLEIYGDMNPDRIILEARLIGVCLIFELIYVFYKLYAEKR